MHCLPLGAGDDDHDCQQHRHSGDTLFAATVHDRSVLTQRQLNRATLARQLLLDRGRLDVVDAVHRVVALQAQEPASPYLALWNRVARFDPAELDTAFAEHRVIKATLMRITLHAVDATDHPPFREAMVETLRAGRLHDRRFKATGLTNEDADALVPELLEFASRSRTNVEFEAFLEARVGPTPKPGPWWAFRSVAPFVHAPTGGPWTFGPRPSYVASPTAPFPSDRNEAVQRLVWRYLEGFGPATVQDIAQFGPIYRPPIRDAVQALAGRLETMEGPDGAELYDVPGGLQPAEDTPAPPRLMAMWDSVLLAYLDRSRVLPAEYRKLVMRNNGDVLPTLLVDGYVCGVWRPVDGGIEATAFHPLARDAWKGLAAEARDLVALLADREPQVYRRYARWWRDLPSAEIRVLHG